MWLWVPTSLTAEWNRGSLYHSVTHFYLKTTNLQYCLHCHCFANVNNTALKLCFALGIFLSVSSRIYIKTSEEKTRLHDSLNTILTRSLREPLWSPVTPITLQLKAMLLFGFSNRRDTPRYLTSNGAVTLTILRVIEPPHCHASRKGHMSQGVNCNRVPEQKKAKW